MKELLTVEYDKSSSNAAQPLRCVDYHRHTPSFPPIARLVLFSLIYGYVSIIEILTRQRVEIHHQL